MTILFPIFLVVLGTLIGSVGALLLKLGAADFSFSARKLLKNYYVIGGFLLYGISTAPFIIALKFGDLSVLYPFVSVAYIWVILLSLRYLKEKMNLYKWVGIISIMLGVVLIGIGK